MEFLADSFGSCEKIFFYFLTSFLKQTHTPPSMVQDLLLKTHRSISWNELRRPYIFSTLKTPQKTPTFSGKKKPYSSLSLIKMEVFAALKTQNQIDGWETSQDLVGSYFPISHAHRKNWKRTTIAVLTLFDLVHYISHFCDESKV